MVLENKSFKEIADKTGVTEETLKKLKADFVAQMRKEHFDKFLAGMDAKGEMLIANKKVSQEVAEANFTAWLRNLGILDDAQQGKKKFNIDDPAHVYRMAKAIQSATQSGILEMGYEWFIMNILSGPQTQVVNITGNAFNTAWDVTVQRGMEAMVNLMVKDSKSAQMGEFKWMMKGLMPGMSRGLTMAMKAWDSENDFFESTVLGTPNELHTFDKAGNIRAAIPGKFGRIVRFPGRALLFADAWFKMSIFQMEVAAQAYRQAKAEGLKGRQLADRVEMLSLTREQAINKYLQKAKPSEEMVTFFAAQISRKDDTLNAEELVADKTSVAWELSREQTAYDMAVAAGWSPRAAHFAVAKAKELTFQETLRTRREADQVANDPDAKEVDKMKGGVSMVEDFAAKLQSARDSNQLLGIFFPFVRTPFNIFRIGLRKTPLGSGPMALSMAKGLYSMRNGKPYLEAHPTLVRDIAEQAIAWTTMMLLWSATQGDDDDDDKMLLITGSSPFGVEKRGIRDLNARATGGEYVIRIGGRNGFSFNYGRIEPFATVLGTVVDAVRSIKRRETPPEQLQSFWNYFVSQAQNKTFLQGISSISSALEGNVNPVEGTKKFLLTAWVPNIIRQPMRNFDDYVRNSKLAPPIYQSFPSGNLASPQVDVYGRDMQKGGNALVRMFVNTPLATHERLEQADRLMLNWNRENPQESYAPQPPRPVVRRNGEDYEMTGPEYERFMRMSGKILVDSLRGRFSERQIRNPREEDIAEVKKLVDESRRKARERLFP
jgi:hypothetical protein